MNNLIWQGTEINQREDNYVNGTHMAKANNVLIGDWLRLKETDAYIQALSIDMQIPISDLKVVVKGGDSTKQGTWLHPLLALNFGRWISPSFAIWCDKHIKTLMETGTTSLALPDIFTRFRRILDEIHVAKGYFVVALEIQNFLSSIQNDYDWSHDEWADLVDASVGKCWANYCKKNLPVAYSTVIKAKYKYLKPNSYELKYLGEFRQWLEDIYIPVKFPVYIAKKQKQGQLLPVTDRALNFVSHPILSN